MQIYTANHHQKREVTMKDAGRFTETRKDINSEKVHSFFDNRTNKELYHRYNLVNYQDNHPELALERDKEEKSRILPLLNVQPDSKILDIGCGVGRWGDELLPIVEKGIYVGVDFSKKLLDVAVEHFSETSKNNFRFCEGRFQDLLSVLKENDVYSKYDVIIVTGVLTYINDNELADCIKSLQHIANDKCRIYMKESVGITSRYTLVDVYSSELACDYNAIYRSVDEYHELFNNYLPHKSLISHGETFLSNNLHNRKETTSYYWVFEH